MEDEPVRFLIFCSNKDLDGTILKVPADQWVQFSKNTSVWYSSNNNWAPVLKREFTDPDHCRLFIIGLYDLEYNFKPLFRFSRFQKIVSVRGMLHPGALSQKSFKKKVYLQIWKLLRWNRKFIFHVTDEREREHVLTQFGKNTQVAIADNFPLLLEKLEIPQKEVGTLKLVSIALISAMKNHLKVLEALEAVGRELWAGGNGQLAAGIVEYNIYGPVKDGKYWEACVELIKKMPPNIKVQYHGAIEPSAIREALSRNHVFILPSKSENFGHSIIEALSAGRPVITSNNTPWNGLESSRAGINVDGTNITKMAEAIGFFLNMSSETLVEWSHAAHEYALKAVDIEKIKGQYKRMFGVV